MLHSQSLSEHGRGEKREKGIKEANPCSEAGSGVLHGAGTLLQEQLWEGIPPPAWSAALTLRLLQK